MDIYIHHVNHIILGMFAITGI